MVKFVVELISVAADLLTILASSIAIFVFLKNRKAVGAVFKILLNYSYQTTLGELKEKLERLNEYNANEPEDVPEIRNILHEIAGQIKGNPRLQIAAPTLAQRIEALASGKRLTEPNKRSLVSELREVLRNLSVNSVEEILGDRT